jgi:putative sigma-54 modulation protein
MVAIQFSGHGVGVTQGLHDFTTEKFARVQKHASNATSVHIFFNVNKLSQEAEATIHIPGHEIYAKAESEDMYKTIDLLASKVIRQLDKYKEKSRS